MNLRARMARVPIARILLGCLTLALAAALLVVFSGILDRYSGVGAVSRELLSQAALLYWAMGCLAIGLVSSWRTHRLQLLATLLSVVISLAFIEVAARVLQLPAGFLHFSGIPSRTQHHIYAPDRKMYAGVYEDSPVFVVTNEDGLRTPYSRDAFRKYGTRIAMLGDSFTFGYGVQQEASLPSRLEALLREKLANTDLAVLNAGIVGYAPLLERLLFENIVIHYDPTLVLLILDPTDIGDDYKYGREAVLEAGRTVFPREGPECGEQGRAPYYGAALEIVAGLLKPLEAPLIYPIKAIGSRLGISLRPGCDYDYYDFKVVIRDVTETTRFFHYRHPLADTRPYFDSTLEHIERTAALARTIGADFLLVVSPRYHHWNPKESPNNWEHTEYATDEPYQFEYFRYFEQARARVDFPIFDLLPAFQATEEFPLVFRDDPHWNSRGNVFAAGTIADYLTREEMLGKD